MPFIGTQPRAGAYDLLDSITVTATTTFNLLLNGTAYYPQSPNHLIVSLNGIIQAPVNSFTVSGNQIIFDSALLASDTIDFILALGDVLSIGTPSANAVTTASIQNNAVTDAKIVGMSSSKLSGALPAIDGSALTGLTESQITDLQSYLTGITGQSINNLSDVYTSMSATDGQLLTWDNTNSRWDAADAPVSLPSQTGNDGKYLTTDGSTASWADTGASAGGVIWENSTTISANYTLATGKNGFSVGPITVSAGVSVTVPSGQRWVVL